MLVGMSAILRGRNLNRFFKYCIIIVLIVNFVTIISPIILWTWLGRIMLFSLITMLYLPFSALIYPALFISVLCAIYASIKILKDERKAIKTFFFLSFFSLILSLISISFNYIVALLVKTNLH